MRINIISIGKLSSDYKNLAGHYSKMIKWNLREVELVYSKKLPETQIKQYEAKLIINNLKDNSYKIILDVLGKQLQSVEFSKIFKNQMMSGQDVDIIIGGAFGLDYTIIKLADTILSLSQMTMPHQLAKLILLEQIYRAQTIIDQHPYHK